VSLPNRKVPKNFPCSCGHSWSKHNWAGISIGDEYCNGIIREDTKRKITYRNLCDCMMFVPDNLRYLEQCLKSKKRGKLK
jgi:hypothetical protein